MAASSPHSYGRRNCRPPSSASRNLGSGLVKGIGPKFAKLIVSHFGLETFDVIEKDADRLLEVPGIGKTRVALIRESWEKQKDVMDIMVFLQGHGVSSNFHIKYLERPGRRTDWQQLKIHNKTLNYVYLNVS